ncbi:statherin isoform X2 [Nomascus leucogenys]|uniref:Statherin n=1 Tax=Nomascus leucogenys TaxID=61853 RepID=G1R7Y6_NOMLE|nr:statherin isoform X2 [Nomascus leucogenys]
MKFLVFAFILALMVSMIGADSSEENGFGPYQQFPEQLYPQPYQPPYQQYPF